MAGGDDETVINENNLWILERENGKIHCGGPGIVQFLNSIPPLFVQLFSFLLVLVGQKYPVELNVSYYNL